MTNEKLTTLLTGALIAAALWFRVLADNPNPTNHEINTAGGAKVISSETMPPREVQLALKETDEYGKICTNEKGSLVNCLEASKDTTCIRIRVGTHSGIRIDCVTGQPIPTDEGSGSRARDVKYRSPY